MTAPATSVSSGAAGGLEPTSVAGWVLRGVLALATAGVIVLTLLGGSGTGALTVAGLVLLAAGIATVARPDSGGAVFLLVASMGAHLMFDTAEIDLGVALLAALIALVHQLAGICAAIPLDARVDLAALRPAALRLAVAVLLVEIAVSLAAIIG